MKNIIPSICCVLITTIASSQQFGFHIGGTSSNLFYKNYEQNFSKKLDFQNVYGVSFGADVNINIKNSICFNTGINFYQNGYKSDELREENSTYLARKVKTNYLQIPLKFILEPKNALLKPSFRIGGYGSYLLGGKFNIDKYPREFEINDEIKKFDAGLILGAGFAYKQFTIEVLYNLGLLNVAQNSNDLYSRSETIMRNKYINVNLIYWF